jgi:Spy/CpxP family protein refolding chaperone
MTATLGLTAEQTSTIERLSTEACALIAKYHEQIQAVLTPEQRAKMQEHHGATDHGGRTHATTRHHGGRK